MQPGQSQPWPVELKPPSYYTAQHRGTPSMQQSSYYSTASFASDHRALFIFDLNRDYLFTESSMLVRSRIPAMELSSAVVWSLFFGMTQPCTAASNDKAMMNIIHDGDGYEDRQVDDFQPEQEP